MKELERSTGKNGRHHLKYRGTRCLNCHHSLDISDKYCPNCSQLNSTKKLRFDDFFNEFFAGILAYDSRFYRTLGALLLKPGKISKDYIEGKRVRYANPYRFYLSASIIFFIIWGLSTSIPEPTPKQPADKAAEEQALAELDSVVKAENLKGGELLLAIAEKDSLQDVYLTQDQLDSLNFWNATWKKLDIFVKHAEEKQITDSQEAMDSLNYNHSSFNHWLYKKAVDMETFISNPGLFVRYFVSKLPFIIFFYLPVFALFIWLLYLRRPFTYMEHLIFTFHNQTTWFVIFTLAILLDNIFSTDWFTVLGVLIFLYYLYRAMRRFYEQGTVKTIVKYIIINIIFFILAVIAAIFSIVVSFAIY